MQTESNNGREAKAQTQLNIAIDSQLHQQLRLQAVLRHQSLREYSEALLRDGVRGEESDKGQSIALCDSAPVNKPA